MIDRVHGGPLPLDVGGPFEHHLDTAEGEAKADAEVPDPVEKIDLAERDSYQQGGGASQQDVKGHRNVRRRRSKRCNHKEKGTGPFPLTKRTPSLMETLRQP